MKEVTLEDFLYLNTPVKLSIAGYIFDEGFLSNPRMVPDSARPERDFGLDKLSAPEILSIIQAFNPEFKIARTMFRDILDNMCSAGILTKHFGEELYTEDTPFNKKASYYSMGNQDIKILARYVLNTTIENNIDYKGSIHPWPSVEDGRYTNSSKWNIIRSLVDKPKYIKEIVETTNVRYDNFYKNARGLSKAGLIVAPYLGKKDRVKKYVLTYKFRERKNLKLSSVYMDMTATVEEEILSGQRFTDKKLHGLFPDKNIRTVNSFRSKMEKLGLISLVNVSYDKPFDLTESGRRLNSVIRKVDDYFENGVLPHTKPQISIYVIKKALNS